MQEALEQTATRRQELALLSAQTKKGFFHDLEASLADKGWKTGIFGVCSCDSLFVLSFFGHKYKGLSDRYTSLFFGCEAFIEWFLSFLIGFLYRLRCISKS